MSSTADSNSTDRTGAAALELATELGSESLVEAIFLRMVLEEGLRHHRREGWLSKTRQLGGRWRKEHQETGAAGEATIIRRGSALALVSVARGFVRVRISARRKADIVPTLAALRRAFPRTCPEATRRADLRFWWSHALGVSQAPRTLGVSSWEEIEGNYAAGTRAQLERLINEFEPNGSGRSVIWTGPPGTGKTHALRALAWEWRSWCEFSVIVDAEDFLGSRTDYLMQVITSTREADYRAIVLEDAGELLASDARSLVGQGLSRFLNLCDGLLGQGERVILIVTTNEPLRRLHPAVSRAGRCAAEIEFEHLPAGEANEWLAGRTEQRVSVATPVSDLFAMAAGEPVPSSSRGARIGFAAPE